MTEEKKKMLEKNTRKTKGTQGETKDEHNIMKKG